MHVRASTQEGAFKKQKKLSLKKRAKREGEGSGGSWGRMRGLCPWSDVGISWVDRQRGRCPSSLCQAPQYAPYLLLAPLSGLWSGGCLGRAVGDRAGGQGGGCTWLLRGREAGGVKNRALG